MKTDFHIVDMPKLDYHGKVYCSRCNKEYPADELVYARPLQGPNSKYLYWYCQTDNCQGYLNSGVYYIKVSS